MSLSLDRIFASLPRTERGKAIVLGADPKGENLLYTNGNSVFIRSLKNPYTECDVYTQHSAAATVAKYSPSRFYICSGDASGKIRIWDTTQQEHVLKNEFHAISGSIRDIAWTGDSQRLIIVGEGREKFGVAILADSGASVGEIGGHSKPINSVDVRRERPFRAATASEDFLANFYEGPPFKFKKQNEEHTNFANCVRFSPNGQVFATASSSGKIILYEGKTSDLIGELGEPAHKGGVYSIAFSPDSLKLVSVSGDKTAKVWSVQDKQLLGEWVFGSTVSDMQVSCEWIDNTIITVSLDGSIHLLNAESIGNSEIQTLLGHSKPITALSVSADAKLFVTGSTDASLIIWEADSGKMRKVSNLQHKNQVQAVTIDNNGIIYSVGIDDTLAMSNLASASASTVSNAMRKLNSQPVDISSAANVVAVACLQQLLLLRDGAEIASVQANGQLRSCAVAPTADAVAVGTVDTKSVLVYSISGNAVQLQHTVEGRPAEVTALAYSPDGAYLAAGFSDRHIYVWSVANGYQSAITSAWCYHTAKVNCLSWSPDSSRLASGSLDCSIIVWSVAEENKRIQTKNAHPMSQITNIAWLDNEQIVSTGQDANIKIWRINN